MLFVASLALALAALWLWRLNVRQISLESEVVIYSAGGRRRAQLWSRRHSLQQCRGMPLKHFFGWQLERASAQLLRQRLDGAKTNGTTHANVPIALVTGANS